MKITSVRSRLTLWIIGIFALVLFGFLVAMHFAVRGYLLSELDRRLQGMAEHQMWLVAHPEVFHRPPPPEGFRRRNNNRPRPARLFDMQGHPIALFEHADPASDTPWDRTGYLKAVAGRKIISIVQDNGTPLRVLSCPLLRDGRQTGVIQVAASYAEAQAALKSLSEMFFLLVPCALAIAGLAGLVLTNRVLQPVRQIVKAADSLHHEDLSQRLPAAGADEFAHLATTINDMLARLESAYTQLQGSVEKERRFTADASHELRTPLTAILANTSLALRCERTPQQYRESLQAINQAGEMMHRLVQDLLLLARADSGQLTMHCQEIDPQELFSAAIALTRQGDQYAPVHVNITPVAGMIHGDEHHLQRVILNLLENALRHTPADGAVTLTADGRPDTAILTVADTGEGIAPDNIPHLGERFYRLDAARARQHGGTGLGLSICKSIIDAHQGTLTIESTVSEGTRVTITLPRNVMG